MTKSELLQKIKSYPDDANILLYLFNDRVLQRTESEIDFVGCDKLGPTISIHGSVDTEWVNRINDARYKTIEIDDCVWFKDENINRVYVVVSIDKTKQIVKMIYNGHTYTAKYDDIINGTNYTLLKPKKEK